MKWHPKGLYALFIPFCPNARPAPPTYEDMFAKREMRVIRFFLQEKTTERRLKINTVGSFWRFFRGPELSSPDLSFLASLQICRRRPIGSGISIPSSNDSNKPEISIVKDA